jgi:hypothetical protein
VPDCIFFDVRVGQGSLGGLNGRIADPTGAGVPAADIRITNIDTSAEVRVSSSDGAYLASSLPPGRYRVTTSKQSLKTIVQEPVTVSTATVSTLDFNLAVGDVAEPDHVWRHWRPGQLAAPGAICPEADFLALSSDRRRISHRQQYCVRVAATDPGFDFDAARGECIRDPDSNGVHTYMAGSGSRELGHKHHLTGHELNRV